MRNRWPIVVSTLLAFALAVVSMPVAALGLGQIEVLSRPGEPLVAEIPIVTTDAFGARCGLKARAISTSENADTAVAWRKSFRLVS